MKRILIVTPSFAIGGTNSSLLSLLQEAKDSQLMVDVFCRHHLGKRKSDFENYHILPENIWLSFRIEDGQWIKKAANYSLRLFRKLILPIGIDLERFYSKIGGSQLGFQKYDAVVSFQEDLSPVVCYYPAKRRIAWIRCEYARYAQIHNNIDESKFYKRIDIVACVSNFTKESFLNYYPYFSNKVKVIYNFLNVDDIKKRSELAVNIDKRFDTSLFTIVSVGRIDAVKQFEKIPEIIKGVLSLKPDALFKWYIIGDGDAEIDRIIKTRIKDFNISNYLIRIPGKDNVFPYVKKADLFVHTSKSETFSRVVNEAKALGVPVLINNYGCSNEFVENGVDGWIVPVDEMSNKLAEFLNSSIELSKIRANLSSWQYNNETIMAQIIDMLK